MSPEPRVVERRLRVRVGVGAVAVLVLLVLGCAVLFAALSPRSTVEVIERDRPTGAARGGVASAALFVHILGAVERPGLYELPEGARAVDVVAAAGGFTDAADQTQLNLARLVSDGEQIRVPELGEAPSAAVVGTTADGKVNLNTADAVTLETLPRVGPSLAARIIAWRESNGRFSAVEDLLSVSGIGAKTFEGLREHVTI